MLGQKSHKTLILVCLIFFGYLFKLLIYFSFHAGVEHASSSPCSDPLGSTQEHALSQESSEPGCKGKILISL